MLRERESEGDMGERTKWNPAFQHPPETGGQGSSADSPKPARTNGSAPGEAITHPEQHVRAEGPEGQFAAGGVGPAPAAALGIAQDRDWCETFAETVQDEIVPRLLALTGEKSERRIPVPSDLVVAVADAAVNAESGVVESHILSHVVNGASMADALLDIVGPAARYLGTAWETDDRDFMEVTIGLGTLHQVLASLSDERLHPAMPNRRILLGPTPGEGHTLGLAIIDHLFRAARWDVVFDPYAERRDLVEQVHGEWFAVAGLALAADGFIDEAAETVAAVREASMNPRLRIVMGGPAFERWDGLWKRIGADAVASDGRAAVEIANRWAADAAAEEPER